MSAFQSATIPAQTTPAATLVRVRTALEGIPFQVREDRDGTASIQVDREHLRAALERLAQRAGFAANTFVTAIDHFPAPARFELKYMFLSIAHNDRVRVSCRLAEGHSSVPTISDLWPGTSFSERECYDMFGIHFEGHPDLRRLLMPQGYEHHPLRKDFPHQGIEPDKLYRQWDAERRAQWTPPTP